MKRRGFLKLMGIGTVAVAIPTSISYGIDQLNKHNHKYIHPRLKKVQIQILGRTYKMGEDGKWHQELTPEVMEKFYSSQKRHKISLATIQEDSKKYKEQGTYTGGYTTYMDYWYAFKQENPNHMLPKEKIREYQQIIIF